MKFEKNNGRNLTIIFQLNRPNNSLPTFFFKTVYIGRFAPSPTGPLHFGSLMTAVASFIEARQKGGQWLIRIEDIDTPRTVPGASQLILSTLAQLNLQADDTVVYQSQRHTYYQAYLEKLNQQKLLYPCICSRKRLNGQIYDGRCRQQTISLQQPHALRVKTEFQLIGFTDELQGQYQQNLTEAVGDFIVKRRDNLFAYQLTTVVDDALQGITHVVRGNDLLDITGRQLYLQQLLQLPTPNYCHLPIALDINGRKLSKQNHAPAVDGQQGVPLLCKILTVFNQHPPDFLWQSSLTHFWEWAIANWDKRKIQGQYTLIR